MDVVRSKLFFGFQPSLPTNLLFGDSLGQLAEFRDKYHFNLPLRWRQVHYRVLAHRQAYDEHRFKIAALKRRPVSFPVGSLVMLHVPPYALDQVGRARGLTTKLLYRWTGPHRVLSLTENPNVVVLDPNPGIVFDFDLSSPIGIPAPQNVVNVARLAKFVPFVPKHQQQAAAARAAELKKNVIARAAARVTAFGAAPVIAAASVPAMPAAPSSASPFSSADECKSQPFDEVSEPLDFDFSAYITRDTGVDDLLLDTPASDFQELLMLNATSTEFIAFTDHRESSAEDASRLEFLFGQLVRLHARFDFPPPARFSSLSELELRLADLTEAASHVLAFNHFYDNCLALQAVAYDNASASAETKIPLLFPSSATQYPPLPPANVRLPGYPLPSLRIFPREYYEDSALPPVPLPRSTAASLSLPPDVGTGFDQDLVVSHNWLPTTTRVGRSTKPPSRFFPRS